MIRTGTKLWRVFPWDTGARPGALFSPSYLPSPTGRGRFDLPHDWSSVLYLTESPDHAAAEAIQAWRGRELRAAHLRRSGLPLALVSIIPRSQPAADIADLCDPAVMLGTHLRPDLIASRDRATTQPIARRVWEAGHSGLRWWSSFWGDWHAVVLFNQRMEGRMDFGDPFVLDLSAPAVTEAASLLGMEIAVTA